MNLVSSRCSRSLFLLTCLVFREVFHLLPPLPVLTRCLRSSMLNSMHRWSLMVVISSTQQSPILEAKWGAKFVRSIIDPRLHISRTVFSTVSSFLATISPMKIPLLSRRASSHSGDMLLESPAMRVRHLASLRLSSRRTIWVSKTSKGSFGEK